MHTGGATGFGYTSSAMDHLFSWALTSPFRETELLSVGSCRSSIMSYMQRIVQPILKAEDNYSSFIP